MFTKRIPLFKLLGFEVAVDLTWLILAVLVTWSLAIGYFPSLYPDLGQTVYWSMGVLGMIGLLFSIVVHELSHSLVAKRYGMQIKGITLFIFGGVAEMHDEPVSPQAELSLRWRRQLVSASRPQQTPRWPLPRLSRGCCRADYRYIGLWCRDKTGGLVEAH